MKRILALTLTLMMILSCAGTAFAAENDVAYDMASVTPATVDDNPADYGVAWSMTKTDVIISTGAVFVSPVTGYVRCSLEAVRMNGSAAGTVTLNLFKGTNVDARPIFTFETEADGTMRQKSADVKLEKNTTYSVTIYFSESYPMAVGAVIGAFAKP